MGNGIAQVFAQSDFRHARRRRAADARFAPKHIEKARQFSRRASSPRPIGMPRWNGSPPHLHRSARRPDYVVEAIVENAEAKRALFTSSRDHEDRCHPRVEHLIDLITAVGAATKRPDKVLACTS